MFEDSGIPANVAPVHFGFAHDAGTIVVGTYQMFWVPFYAVALATGVPPLMSLLVFTRLSRRRDHGRCQSCGYDLLATADRCPECRTLPNAKELTSGIVSDGRSSPRRRCRRCCSWKRPECGRLVHKA